MTNCVILFVDFFVLFCVFAIMCSLSETAIPTNRCRASDVALSRKVRHRQRREKARRPSEARRPSVRPVDHQEIPVGHVALTDLAVADLELRTAVLRRRAVLAVRREEDVMADPNHDGEVRRVATNRHRRVDAVGRQAITGCVRVGSVFGFQYSYECTCGDSFVSKVKSICSPVCFTRVHPMRGAVCHKATVIF